MEQTESIKPTSTETNIVTSDTSNARGDVSAITVARMMGLATLGEVKLLESKIDLLSTKLGSIQVKLEKVSVILQGLPSGADLERIDVHVGAIKQMLKDVLGDKVVSSQPEGEEKKPSSKIVTNQSV